jgi:hypothetical protein
VSSGSVLVKYTYDGDSDVNGVVNIDDYFRIDLGYANQLAGGYRTGDFNYSGGPPNGDDYFLIDSAFLAQGIPLSVGAVAFAVPDPSAGLLVLGAFPLALVNRRRRRLAL